VNDNRKAAGAPNPPTAIKPRLLLTIELEETPQIRLMCSTAEDEQRLVSWLEVSAALRDLGPRILQTIVEAA
jgi:hypothetical protein